MGSNEFLLHMLTQALLIFYSEYGFLQSLFDTYLLAIFVWILMHLESNAAKP